MDSWLCIQSFTTTANFRCFVRIVVAFYATIRVHCNRKVRRFFVVVWRVRFLLCNFQNEQKRRHKKYPAKSLKREACACNKQREARREDTWARLKLITSVGESWETTEWDKPANLWRKNLLENGKETATHKNGNGKWVGTTRFAVAKKADNYFRCFFLCSFVSCFSH